MVGTGIFTTSGFIAPRLGEAWLLLLLWLAGGVLALAGALCYAELGARFPRAGGEYVFLREAFGPFPAFLSGWVSLVVGFSAPIAAAAVAGAGYLLQAWPGLARPLALAGYSLPAETWLALLLLGALTALHCLSLGLGLGVQNVLTLVKLAALALLAAGGLGAAPAGVAAAVSPAAGASLAGGVATSLVFVSFAYSGFNAAAYLGEELRRPGRNLPLALLLGTGLVTLLYLLLNWGYVHALGMAGLVGVREVGAAVAKAAWGPALGGAFSMLVGLCLLSNLGSMIITGPRVYFAMARDRLFFPQLARLSPRSGLPIKAILTQALVAAVLVLTASFETLLFSIGFILSIFSLLTVAGLMVLRRRAPARSAGFATPLYPLTPLVFLAGQAWMIIFALADDPRRAWPALGALGLGGMVYWYFQRRHGRSDPQGDERS